MPDHDSLYWIPLADVRLWDDNPNIGDVGAICALIEKFGFRQPIGIFKGDVTKDGNHRVRALQSLLKEGWIPTGSCIRTTDRGIEVAAIDNSDLSEQDGSTLGIGFNRSTRLGHDDAVKLLALLTPLPSADILAAGYDENDLLELQAILPDDWKEYDESIVDEVEYIICPHCGEKFPK